MTQLEVERHRRGWSQTELAYLAHLTQNVISEIERRRVLPSLLHLERLGQALNVPAGTLLNDVRPEEHRSFGPKAPRG